MILSYAYYGGFDLIIQIVDTLSLPTSIADGYLKQNDI